MNASGRRLKLLSRGAVTAHVLWLVTVVVYFTWCSATERGLYGWLMRRQIEANGSFSGTLSFALPIVLLAAPSLWVLFGHVEARDSASRSDPGYRKRVARKGGIGMLIGAVILLCIAFLCAVMAARAPGYVEPIEIGAEQFANGDYPRDRPIQMWARPELSASYGYSETNRRASDRQTSWLGVRPVDGPYSGYGRAPKMDGPIAVFLEGSRVVAASDEPPTLAETIMVSGVVVENGLPDLARVALESEGVEIARPHYVLRQPSQRTGWMTGMSVSLFFAFAAAVIGAILLMRGTGVIPDPRGQPGEASGE